MWVLYIIFSAIFLGIYDVFKKVSVTQNAVLPVLWISSLVQCVIFAPVILASFYEYGISQESFIYTPFSGFKNQLLIFFKTLLVLGSWVCSFFALKHLPITLAGPIRATSPAWTLAGAIFLLGEQLNPQQWLGISIIFLCIILYSRIGKREGIIFLKNKWVFLIFLATLLGAASGLYDKYLLAHLAIHRMEVQAWFSIYQILILTPVVLVFWWPQKQKHPFTWRWSIPCIGIFLIFSDILYFYALSLPGALIAVISLVRRGSIVISFLSGLFIFKEQHLLKKAAVLIGVVIGIVILYYS